MDTNLIEAEIDRQFEIQQRWNKHVLTVNPASRTLDDDKWGIVPQFICGPDYGITYQDLATFPNASILVGEVQHHLVNAYERRNLGFPARNIFAIANPGNVSRDREIVIYFGFLEYLSAGYDTRIEVLLDKEGDKEAFQFFFALKLIKCPIMDVDDFLEHHLTISFRGEQAEFGRFLTLLLRYIPREMAKFQEAGINLDLSEDLRSSVVEWMASVLPAPVEQETDNILRMRFTDDAIIDALHADLSPYFNEESRNHLKDLLAGLEAPPVTFNSPGKLLIGAFFMLDTYRKVILNKVEITNWLVGNFRYISPKTKQPTSFNYRYTYGTLTGQQIIKKEIQTPLTDKILKNE